MKKIISKLEEIFDNKVDEVTEDGKVVGFEINTYTDGGVNMIVFIDMRDVKKFKYNDVMAELKKWVEDFDIDEQIMLHRQAQDYCNAFTIKESVHDFETYKKSLEEIVKNL